MNDGYLATNSIDELTSTIMTIARDIVMKVEDDEDREEWYSNYDPISVATTIWSTVNIVKAINDLREEISDD